MSAEREESDLPGVDYGFRSHCPACGHDSATTYRCEKCGNDLVEEKSSAEWMEGDQ